MGRLKGNLIKEGCSKTHQPYLSFGPQHFYIRGIPPAIPSFQIGAIRAIRRKKKSPPKACQSLKRSMSNLSGARAAMSLIRRVDKGGISSFMNRGT